MGRKLNLIIMMFISMLLITLPLYARSGRGGGQGGFGRGGFNRGSGGHGFSGHRGFSSPSGFRNGVLRGLGSGGQAKFGGRGFEGRSVINNNSLFRNIGNRGFDNKRFRHDDPRHFDHKLFGDKDFRRFDRKHSGHKHHHHHHDDDFSSSFFFGLGFGAVFPFVAYPFYAYPYYAYPYYAYPYDYPPDSYPYPEQSYGDLEIQASPEDVEIYVDGKFIGFAGDFDGRAVVLVPSGNHVLEFRYNGSSSSSSVYVTPDSTSAVSGEFKPLSESPEEEPAPQY